MAAKKKTASKRSKKLKSDIDGEKAKERARFLKWIDDIGPAKIAADPSISVTRFAVYGWRRYAQGRADGYRPDPSKMGAILRLAAGALTAVDIYGK